ncbi:MAG: GNAT family N-acetyltransferase [Caldilineaceae bacterium]|nr:GNAT family N-acetyltransferase [Caldilineaceae bacterium]
MNTLALDKPVRTIRPATPADFPAIANLLVQLYAVELPGALQAPQTAQQALLHYTLTAKANQGLHGRYVACDATGEILATAVLEYPGTMPYDRAPNGTISQALSLIGYGATARLLLIVARSLVPTPRPQTPDAVWFHSVIVDPRYRGQGVGRTLMTALAEQAQAHGYRSAWLQVLAMNQPARRLYAQLGYEERWSTPRWQQWLTWPSYLLCKTLSNE